MNNLNNGNGNAGNYGGFSQMGVGGMNAALTPALDSQGWVQAQKGYFPWQAKEQQPQVTITKDGRISFNNTAKTMLGDATHVQVYFNQNNGALGFKVCEPTAPNAFPITRNKGKQTASYFSAGSLFKQFGLTWVQQIPSGKPIRMVPEVNESLGLIIVYPEPGQLQTVPQGELSHLQSGNVGSDTGQRQLITAR